MTEQGIGQSFSNLVFGSKRNENKREFVNKNDESSDGVNRRMNMTCAKVIENLEIPKRDRRVDFCMLFEIGMERRIADFKRTRLSGDERWVLSIKVKNVF
ncbi:uncharacterized protein LOC121770746 isoform X2 [Salvia splendens]|uniref:uncharacterized protein LOC121770746 isoform X2 n=1 Tax=Salvia splendens TaxID=180675 RepID=UPI001C26A779|nr:uncharacterized protein LOC121770746 isoform X2 [Salvia splendens]